MNCPYCGHAVNRAQARFCPHCGKPLTSPDPAAPPTPPSTPPSQKGRGAVWVVLALVLAAVVVALVWFFVGRDDAGQPDIAPQPTAAATMPAIALPTSAPTLLPIPTAAPTPTPTPLIPTPVPTTTPEPTALSALPGLEVQPDWLYPTDARALVRVTTESDRLNMRSGPSTDYAVVDKAECDELVYQVGGLSGDGAWVVIERNGVYGWASAEYLALE